MSGPIHVVHLLYRFAAGGLENVLVQLVNGLPHAEFRHTIIALTEADAAFAARIQRPDVEIISLHKAPGQPFALYPHVFRLLRRLRPDVVHSCNIAALEFMPVAALAGVPRRIHAEHGWDVADPDGSNRHYQRLRRFYRHFVHAFIAVSPQLHDYLRDAISVPVAQLHLIPNGVDTVLFQPRGVTSAWPADYPFTPQQHWVVGTIGRLEPIKNQMLLVEAFIHLLAQQPDKRVRVRLAIVGNGPLAPALRERMVAAGLGDCLWLPGARSDIAAILQVLDCFVLPSLAEGTSCTLLEAMAAGVPVIATAVGGNPALLQDGKLGCLVASEDVAAMSAALGRQLAAEGDATVPVRARAHVCNAYSLTAMLQRYAALLGGD